MILDIVSFYLEKTYNYEKLTLHYRRYPGNWLGIRIFCVFYRKYNTRIISYSNRCIAFGRYQTGMIFGNGSKSQERSYLSDLAYRILAISSGSSTNLLYTSCPVTSGYSLAFPYLISPWLSGSWAYLFSG
jgi:hypothetical protein